MSNIVMVGSKTPVSILNEYFVSRQIVPRFDIIEQSTGHNPKFTYRVSAGEDFAVGSGSSKQQAKHASAQLLLDILIARDERPEAQLDQAIRHISVPNDNQLNINAVGELTFYCGEKNYPEAVYDLVSDEGPPHARIFTFKCTVSNLTELGTARTKKQAKHHSAYAMLSRLKHLCNEEHNPVVKLNFDKPKMAPNENKERDEKSNENYYKLLNNTRRFGTTSAYIAEHYRHYAKLMEKSKTLAELSENKDLLKTPRATLNQIVNELGERIETLKKSGTERDIVFLEVTITPKLIYAGFSEEEAISNALHALSSMI